jgi:hypothetical protein
MNWYKYSKSELYDIVSNDPSLTGEIIHELPQGYYYTEENGIWSVLAPNEEVVATNEPTQKGAKKRALELLNYILLNHAAID